MGLWCSFILLFFKEIGDVTIAVIDAVAAREKCSRVEDAGEAGRLFLEAAEVDAFTLAVQTIFNIIPNNFKILFETV